MAIDSLEEDLAVSIRVLQDRIKTAPQQGVGSKYEVFLQGIEKILSKENIDQKTRIIFENVIGITKMRMFTVAYADEVLFEEIPDPWFLKKKEIKKQFDVLEVLTSNFITLVISLEGKGRTDLIELARAFNLVMQEHEHEMGLAKQLIGAPGLMANR